jgi:hypothetical protein
MIGTNSLASDWSARMTGSRLRQMGRPAEDGLAANVLHDLLRHIAIRNAKNTDRVRPGHYVFQVSHAWTEGPMIYLVYRTPPSNITWGLVRDTTRSLIDPGSWNDNDDPALYYYLIDLEEGWPGNSSLQPGDDPEVIRWSGWPLEDLIERIGDLPESYRQEPLALPTTGAPSDPSSTTEPRRYGNRL